MSMITKEFRILDKTTLNDLYWNQEYSLRDIAKQNNLSYTAIRKLFEKFNIQKRSKTQAMNTKRTIEKTRHFREENGSWKGNNTKTISLHGWIRKYKPKTDKCEICKEKKKLELSFNHDLGDYTRNLNDYQWLCSKCHSKRDIYKYIGKNNSNWKGGKIELKCEHCYKLFYRYPSLIKGRKHHFCSIECYNNWGRE